jgi:anti-sigma factor RsiW
MKCKHIQELIFTDYSDGQLSERQTQRVEGHLARCGACRLLAQQVRQQLTDPLKVLPQLRPDEFSWQRLKSKIEQNEQIRETRVAAWDILGSFFYSFRPAAVMTCVAAMLIVGTVVLYTAPQAQKQPYLSYVMDTDSQGGEDNVSAGIERYFL